MAGPFYVDPAATGGATGADWTNAWVTLQTALDTAVAGEIIYARGTEVITAALDVDTNAGSNAAGHIKIIGCNAAGNRDGTRFVVNANNNDIHGITLASNMTMIWFENIEVKNCGGTTKNGFNFNGTICIGCRFINCSSHHNSGSGFYNFNGSGGHVVYFRCTAYNNTVCGFKVYATANQRILFCSAHDNTGSGIGAGGAYSLHYGTLIYDNGDDGINNLSYTETVLNCTINGNTDDGIFVLSYSTLGNILVGASRITNHSGSGDMGINAVSCPLLTFCDYFEDNDGDNIQNAEFHSNISIDGTATSSNIEDQANTNEGYTDLTNDAQNFNLRSDASLRRTRITIPVV
jgi:hypothetical protein